MERVERLFSFSKKVSYKKSEIYKEIEKQQSILVAEGFKFDPESYFDIYCYQIIIEGIKNKINIAKAYDAFISNNFDLLEHCNYEQRRKMIQVDIDKVLEKSASFQYQDTTIYIPYLEEFMNQRYCNDHAMVLLKQHIQHLNNYPKSIDQMLDLYQEKVLLSDFCSLEYVGKYFNNDCFYSKEGIFISYQVEHKKYSEFFVVDKYNKELPSSNDVKELLELVESNRDDVIDFMIEKQFIHPKYKKKLEKKRS